MTARVYLDHNATTTVRPEAVAAVSAALTLTGNASSVHGYGRAVRQTIEEARQAVAGLAGAEASGLIFTSGGTEANNLALKGLPASRLLVAATEHASVLEAVPTAERLPVSAVGVLDLAALEETLEAARDERDDAGAGPTLVSVQWANNETGVIQPVAEIAALAHRHGALFHCDAVQAAGKISLDMAATKIDFLTLSAHKIGGPQGVGALAMAPGRRLAALLQGGGQEQSFRAGTENLPGIAGFGAAAQAITAQAGKVQASAADWAGQAGIAALRDELETTLRTIAPDVIVFGAGAARLANTSCFAQPGLLSETQLMALDLAGVAVSAGSACSSGKVAPSHVLAAMGVEADVAGAAIRVSLGWNSRPSDVAAFLEAWTVLYSRACAA